MRAGLVGAGVIGAGWAARLAMNGVEVAVHDPDPATAAKLDAVLAAAGEAWGALYDARPTPGAVRVAASVADAVEGADLVIESVPERLEAKRAVYALIEAAALEDAPIASSTSGLRPSLLQAEMKAPGRFLVAHPFNPVYLLPLVELVGGTETDPATIERARGLFAGLGMHPLVVRREIDAFIADRLLEALWREALWLVKDEVATTAEVDDAIRYGFGVRFAQMGLFESYRIAGGERGMRHFLDQFGPCLAWPWSRLTDVPDMDAGLVETIAAQSDAQSGDRTIAELEHARDASLVAILKALATTNAGAGTVVRLHRERLMGGEHGTAVAVEQASIQETER